MKLLLKYMPLVLIPCLLAGCVPIPHTTLRSPEFRGEVLDARTHAPIQGAKVFLTYRPSHSCRTDSSGHFRLRATYNFHLAYLLTPGQGDDWPFGEYDNGVGPITVSHTNYMPAHRSYGGDVQLEVLLNPMR
jgi:hypothetical protein